VSDRLWSLLMVALLFGAYRQFSNAWFLYQCRKRRQMEESVER
jgi:hypothetical protein